MTRPDKPTDLTATPSDRQVVLRWDNPHDSSITRYQYRQNEGTRWSRWRDIAGSGPDTTSVRVTNLTNGRAYRFEVRAVNARGKGAASDTATATPVPYPAQTHRARRPEPGDRKVTLTWEDPSDPTITKYEYNQRTGSTFGAWKDIPMSAPGQTNATSFTVEGLVNGTAYTFAIRASNANRNGSPSDQVTATPTALPAAPTGFRAVAGDGKVKLRWADPRDPSITGYEYKQREESGRFGEEWTKIGKSAPGEDNATSFTVTDLSNDTTYVFIIRAVNPAGGSPPTASVSVTPADPPGAPTEFKANPADGKVTLKWEDPLDGTITKYQYRQKEGSGRFGRWMDIPGSGPSTVSHTVTGLRNGTNYRFAVRAVNAIGNGDPSVSMEAIPGAVQGASAPAQPQTTHPARPAGLTAILADGVVTLTWNDPEDAGIVKYEYNVRVR